MWLKKRSYFQVGGFEEGSEAETAFWGWKGVKTPRFAIDRREKRKRKKKNIKNF